MRWIVATSLRYRYLVVFLAVVLMVFGISPAEELGGGCLS